MNTAERLTPYFAEASSPIGVFDSGVGGLSVLRELCHLLPHECYLYVADSGFAPYGNRSCEYIVERSTYIVNRFLEQGVKAVVVACNTATSVAVDQLRTWCPVPIVAMEPAIKPAALHTKSGKVGVLATQQTICSANVNRLIAEHGQEVDVVLHACDGFVELVERGELETTEALQLVSYHVNPLLEQSVDTLVLGCTHYPFLVPLIRQVVGSYVTIIDPSAAVARQLQRKLMEQGLLASDVQCGDVCFLSSGDLAVSERIMTHLWKSPLQVQSL